MGSESGGFFVIKACTEGGVIVIGLDIEDLLQQQTAAKKGRQALKSRSGWLISCKTAFSLWMQHWDMVMKVPLLLPFLSFLL